MAQCKSAISDCNSCVLGKFQRKFARNVTRESMLKCFGLPKRNCVGVQPITWANKITANRLFTSLPCRPIACTCNNSTGTFTFVNAGNSVFFRVFQRAFRASDYYPLFAFPINIFTPWNNAQCIVRTNEIRMKQLKIKRVTKVQRKKAKLSTCQKALHEQAN